MSRRKIMKGLIMGTRRREILRTHWWDNVQKVKENLLGVRNWQAAAGDWGCWRKK